ncbi:hypothetical protein [Enterococcus avium]|uniref:hypothetical protein n=1 Tax=Enterococcus avium TaxID=33945 RepID=UPI00232DBF3A|nr:hypothetical protein [Enterococcus avium]MDB1714500.1 hypothetical protein [Enterococcus avium]MDB1721985.1 hypothetical protein [Enterococcus avium]
MKNTNYQLEFSEAAASYVSDITKTLEDKNQDQQVEQKNESPEDVLTRSEVEKMLEDHLSKIENLILNQEKQIDQMDNNIPEAEVIEKTEGFLAKIKEALKEFADTVKYLVGDMTDDARLKVKNGINSRVLCVNSSIKSLGEKIDKKFAIEEKVVRIDPREAKRNAAALEKEKQTKTEATAQPQTDVEINLSKSAEVTFNPPRINQGANLSEKEVNSLTTNSLYDFKKVSEFAFNKRAAEPEHNWQAHQDKFGDRDLSQAWNVFMQDAWNIQAEITPMIGSELASTWEKDYYDFFYEGGKEAYDSSVEKGTQLNYSPEAIQHFEKLYDSQIAKAMQESLADEIIGKHSPAAGKKYSEKIQGDQPLPHEIQETPSQEQKVAASKPNKFEQRMAAAVEKNKMIEKNMAESMNKHIVNEGPTMK